MTTRRDFHGHFSFMNRLKSKLLRLLDSVDKTHISPATRLNFERWKCIPTDQKLLQQSISVCNGDILEGLKVMEYLNGKIIDMVKKSDTEYKITFKNKRVYKVVKYL